MSVGIDPIDKLQLDVAFGSLHIDFLVPLRPNKIIAYSLPLILMG